MADQTPDPITSLLQDYEKALKLQKSQRTLVEHASTTFGELASRVEAELGRRTGLERRNIVRATTERRVRHRRDEPPTPRPFSGAHLERRN